MYKCRLSDAHLVGERLYLRVLPNGVQDRAREHRVFLEAFAYKKEYLWVGYFMRLNVLLVK